MLFLVKVILTLWVSWVHGQERECIVPDIEQNLIAQPRKEKYVIGDVLKFSCRNRLHSLVGPDSLQCYHFGWSPNPPTCKEKVQSCDQPPQLSNGTFAHTPKEEYGHGEVVEYVCKPRFLLKGAKKIQCVDGEWTPLPDLTYILKLNVCCGIFTEEHSTCGDVPELDDGEVVSQHGQPITMETQDDFTMIGHSSVTCIKGTWTQTPQCIATIVLKTCKLSGATPYKLKLTRRIHYEHNRKISYTCERTSVQKHSVCMNGKWEPEVTCTEAPRCPPPPQIPNSQHMTLTVNYQEGEKISILCQENFLMQEGEEIVCQDGRWQSIPRCVETICSSPPSYGNAILIGQPKNSYKSGEQVTYRCPDYYQMDGSNFVECRGGIWIGRPTCKETICSSPPSYGNAILIGQPKNSYKSGEQVTYRCPDYYQMDGSNFVECRGGIWIGRPTCKDEKPRYRNGDTARYECTNSLGLFGNAVVTCLSGKWTDPPECKDLSCGSPPPVQNAVIPDEKPRYRHGDTARYECMNSLGLFGNAVSPQENVGPLPLLTMETLPRIPKAVYAPGSSVEYQCQAYYELEGNRRITCRDGEWSEPPKCLDLPCGSPPPVQNAFIPDEKPRYQRGDTARYECRHPLGLFGNAVVTCLSGKWTDPPECKDPSCGSPPPVQNAFIPNEKPRYRPGDTARYQCRHLLDLLGNAVVTCLSGKWTDPPECKVHRKMWPPPIIDNGDITTYPRAVYAPGSSVEYQCQAYYELEGNRRITCRDGVWSEPPKCLDACVISEEIMREHNIALKWSDGKKIYATTNDYTEFRCRRGYRKVSPASAFRAQCREGKLEYPTCALKWTVGTF
ncbi:hypothetical protein QTO34_012392 [Cnephaeus nilssonii]|uniref:Sushi domain-containing protein n=1 Tax=Cnephaeus nilssonii TaxID=3371016 RepID=A0AA40HB45_CNENI|nr:hypothetical protein QTO34_012392 [Eptesicus nilssonii]